MDNQRQAPAHGEVHRVSNPVSASKPRDAPTLFPKQTASLQGNANVVASNFSSELAKQRQREPQQPQHERPWDHCSPPDAPGADEAPPPAALLAEEKGVLPPPAPAVHYDPSARSAADFSDSAPHAASALEAQARDLVASVVHRAVVNPQRRDAATPVGATAGAAVAPAPAVASGGTTVAPAWFAEAQAALEGFADWVSHPERWDAKMARRGLRAARPHLERGARFVYRAIMFALCWLAVVVVHACRILAPRAAAWWRRQRAANPKVRQAEGRLRAATARTRGEVARLRSLAASKARAAVGPHAAKHRTKLDAAEAAIGRAAAAAKAAALKAKHAAVTYYAIDAQEAANRFHLMEDETDVREEREEYNVRNASNASTLAAPESTERGAGATWGDRLQWAKCAALDFAAKAPSRLHYAHDAACAGVVGAVRFARHVRSDAKLRYACYSAQWDRDVVARYAPSLRTQPPAAAVVKKAQ